MEEQDLYELRTKDSLAAVAWKLRARVFPSQVQAAQYLRVNRSTILRYENGDIVASLDYLACLSLAISDREAKSSQEIDIVQLKLLQDLNKVRVSFYPDELAFKSWQHVVRAAERYMAEVEQKRTEP